MIPEEYVIDSKKRTIYQACEAMTHSNHRRKGLFEMLVNKCNDYLDKIVAEAGFEFVLYVDDNLYEASEYDKEKANRLPRINMIEESLEEVSLRAEMFHPKLRKYARIFS
ncbi:MAG: hypothetical protein H0U49_00595 [Parachlamydiaceae bacterium]|nr:hypothetical protein [Parachlamydiaceae bacterium]